MPKTYEPIATTTLGSATAEIVFSSITGTYTDLILIVTAQAASAEDLCLRFNSDSGTNYSRTTLSGTGSSAVSNRVSDTTSAFIDRYAIPPTSGSSFSTYIVHIMNYSNTTTNKTILSRSSEAGGGVDAIVNLWRNTAAINAIRVAMASAVNLLTGTTATLYGIKAA